MNSATSSESLPRICIYGAGSIGCYVGGRLQAEGLPVSFIGRPRVAEQIAEHGLQLSDWQNARISLPASSVDFRTDDSPLADADLVIVTVKSAATAEVGQVLAEQLRPTTVVMSLQNGIRNGEVLKMALPENPVLSAMISFNVVQQGQGRFHAGTEGELMAESHPLLERLLPYFQRAALPLELRGDMLAVQWSKLAMNLNNAINALADIPLKEQLSQRNYRRCLALMIGETVNLLKVAQIQPAKILPLPIGWIARLLRMPDWVFTRVASSMLAMDPLARSSMWEDLQQGRLTEVDWLNGEVVALARRLGREAPVNEKIVALMHAAEQGGRRQWPGEDLYAQLRLAKEKVAS